MNNNASKIVFSTLMLASLSANATVYSTPTTLSDITGNAAHTEIDSGDQLFRLTDTADAQNDATAFLLLELANNANVNSFGIIGSDGVQLEVFSGTQSSITSATLAFNVDTNEVTNLTTGASAFIDDQIFGFYLDGVDGLITSLTSLNGGVDLMMAFEVSTSGHSDLFGSDYVLAFEDTKSGDKDFNDLVVGVSDIAGLGNVTTFNIPEPMPLALMGLGLIGLGLSSKSKSKS